jgi:uncharacterized protein
MSTMLFVYLPVKNLATSTRFFADLGFSFDQQFPVENMKALVINDDSRVVLVAESQFKADIEANIKKDIADTTTSAEAIVQLRVDSRQQVDELVDKALAAGGQMANPTNDRGFLYGRSFQDLDRHLWDVFSIDPAALQGHA